MDNLKIKIYQFFGKARQYAKLKEEVKEVLAAYFKYKAYRSKDNLLHLIEELNDALNVAEGIGLVEHGITENETRAEKHSKLHRTEKIMSECKTPEEYEEFRKKMT